MAIADQTPVAARLLAETRVRPAFEALAGVREVRILGGAREIVQMRVDSGRRAAFGVVWSEIEKAIQAALRERPSLTELSRILIGEANDRALYLSDVAQVERTAEADGWAGLGAHAAVVVEIEGDELDPAAFEATPGNDSDARGRRVRSRAMG
ncbi:MAG: efflux RND transporter permease subunit [Myxococcaceae bacterium]|nr:efflux RND transporter permease subunit [Myxococcaceae bacterium]